jgi:HlyD family secretion protein
VLGAGAWLFAPTLLGPRILAERVLRADLVRTLVATGRVQTPYRVEIGAQVSGTATAVLVDRGDQVTQGQLLIRLEDSEARATLAQAAAAVAQAEARLREIEQVTSPVAEQALAQAQAIVENARRAHDRASQLRAAGVAPQSALDEARRALDVAEAQLRSVRTQAEGARPGGIARTLAETALRQARATLDVAEARFRYTVVRAPLDGTVIAREVDVGDAVQPGRALLTLSPEGDTEIVLRLDERNLGLVALGQPALASADAHPDRRFAAEVGFISPLVDPQRGSVEVKLRVPDPPAYLRQDMTVSVDIAVGRSDAALVVPATAVRDIGGPHPWALRIGPDGRAERRDLVLGLRGDDSVEVRAGLAEGDLVIPVAPPGRPVREGQRVRVAPR